MKAAVEKNSNIDSGGAAVRDKQWTRCTGQCLIFGLSFVAFVLALAGMGAWLTAGALPLPGIYTLLAVGFFLASVGAGVALACAIFCVIEAITEPLVR